MLCGVVVVEPLLCFVPTSVLFREPLRHEFLEGLKTNPKVVGL